MHPDIDRLRVRRVTLAELPECLALRRRVFIEEQQVPEDEELDGLDEACTHFLAEWQQDGAGYADLGFVPVGTARLRFLDEALAKAERVCVLPEMRGVGAGRALMVELEAEARRHGRRRVKLAAQESARPFYERLGYQAFGERFMDAGIPHVWMDKELAGCRPG